MSAITANESAFLNLFPKDQGFDEVFQSRHGEIIAAAENASDASFYSPWKKTFFIDLPKTAEAFLSFHINLEFSDGITAPIYPVKTAIAVASCILASCVFTWSMALLNDTLLPFVASQFPEMALFVRAYATVAFNYIKEYSLRFCVAAFAVGAATYSLHLENPVARTVANTVCKIAFMISSACWKLWWPAAELVATLANAYPIAEMSWNMSNSLAETLSNSAQAAEENRLRICKEKAFAIFVKISNPQ